jgi:hypothetical protein
MMTKIGYVIYLAIVLTALGFAVGLIICTYREDVKQQPAIEQPVQQEVVG